MKHRSTQRPNNLTDAEWRLIKSIRDAADRGRRREPVRNDPRLERAVRGDVLRACSSKKWFPNAAVADRVAVEVSERRGATFRSYHCTFCARWHLTQEHDAGA